MEFALDQSFKIPGTVEAAKQMRVWMRSWMSRRGLRLHFGALLVLGQLASGDCLVAQLPGLPVLQNSFVGPGFAVAANLGGGGGGSAYAAAVGWAPGSARFQVSVGAGAFVSEGETGGAFGARVAMPVFSLMNGNLGIAAFGGVGGARGPRVQGSRVGLGHAPIGAAIGYRRALGTTRGFSVYAAPFFSYHRSDFGNSTESAGLFRISVGGDFAITRSLGVTAGLELGGTRSAARDPGPDGAIWGAGVSYAFGRR